MQDIKTSGKMEVSLKDGSFYLVAKSTDMDTHEDSIALMQIMRELRNKTFKISFGGVSDFLLVAVAKAEKQ